jgi:hypothetical protein
VGLLAGAQDKVDSRGERPGETLGFVEWVVMQDTGERLKARLDTGAKTSSLQATRLNRQPAPRWLRSDAAIAFENIRIADK